MIILVASERRRERATCLPLFDPDETDDTKRDRARVDSYAAAAGDFTSSVDDNQSRLFIDTASLLSGEKTSLRGCVVSRPLRVIHTAKVHATLCWSATEAALLVHFLVPTAPYFCDTLLDFYYLIW